MPEYFYHVGIELFDKQSLLIDLSKAFNALGPLRPAQARAIRDTRFDAMRPLPSQPSKHTRASSSDDRRIGQVVVEAPAADDISAGIGTQLANVKTRAGFVVTEESDIGERGIVHLYRDAEESPGLYLNGDRAQSSHPWDGSASARSALPKIPQRPPPKDEECNLLSILAVPSYMTPKDFLAFVGNDTRKAVSHFRMLRTSRLNRYMVLMKFRDGRFARQWQHDWNGRVFNSMEPETCHVVFVQSVEVFHNQDLQTAADGPQSAFDLHSSLVPVKKPVAPPTPSLIELPTCPVCLERMDESTGLLTVLCQHVFHCSCLEKWSGGGCPVCRYSNDDFSVNKPRPNKSKKFDEFRGEFEVEDADELECGVCHRPNELWQCLICGYVGCGRYLGKHAFDHYQRTGHNFALNLQEDQGVWDYDHDCWVHRIIANGTSENGEKLVELPGRRRQDQVTALQSTDDDVELAKRENLAFEYTQLLTSQLESQRVYFEEVVARAVDKAADASKRADEATERASTAMSRMETALTELTQLRYSSEIAEKNMSRLELKSRKLEDAKSQLEAEYQTTKRLLDDISANAKTKEETAIAERNRLFRSQLDNIRKLKEDLATKDFYVESLQEQCQDLRMQLQGQKQLQELVKSGQLSATDLEGATIEMAPKGVTPEEAKYLRALSRPKSNKSSTKAPSLDPTDEEIRSSVTNSAANQVEDQPQIMAETPNKLLTKILDADDTYELSSTRTVDDLRQLAIEAGILTRKEEKDLYDTEDNDSANADPTVKESSEAKAKSKRKKKTNRKKK